MATCRADLPVFLRRQRDAMGTAPLAQTVSAATVAPADAAGFLTIAMTAGDIPVTTGNPDRGFKDYRLAGYNPYDALLLSDLSKSRKPSEPKPGLATSYEIDPNDQKRGVTNVYPHDWPYLLNFARGPFQDLRVGQAVSYAINRQDVIDLLGGIHRSACKER
jgi:ABC-type transport system substrate-binding protein